MLHVLCREQLVPAVVAKEAAALAHVCDPPTLLHVFEEMCPLVIRLIQVTRLGFHLDPQLDAVGHDVKDETVHL
jgi:hypothetical protein